MPIYEYICAKCDSQFELLVRGEQNLSCPECGSGELNKEFSVPAAHSQGDSLPMMDPGNCGRPQCGGGRCAGMEG